MRAPAIVGVFAVLLACGPVGGGCRGDNRTTRLHAWEQAYDTGAWSRWRRHPLAEEFGGISLRFPGLVVAFEKAAMEVVGCTNEAGCPRRELFPVEERWFRADPADPTSPLNDDLLDWAEDRLDDWRPHFISHVVEFTHGRARPIDDPTPDGFPFIDDRMLYSVYDAALEPGLPHPLYRRTHDEALQTQVRQALARRCAASPAPTHILVIAMGWNVNQRESVENFNSFVVQLMRQRPPGQPFRPLFIGLTWPAAWSNDLVTALAYPNKAHDADEIGATWVSLLIRDLLVPLKRKHDIPLVLVGHSFGARILTRAAHGLPSERTLGRDAEGRPHVRPDDIDLVVSLNGAFSANRFVHGRGDEGAPYARFAQVARKFVCVWSEHDAATTPPGNLLGAVGYLVGGGHVRRLTTRKKLQPTFTHFRLELETPAGARFARLRDIAPSDGDTVAWSQDCADPQTVAIVNASDLVRYEAWGMAGGAHSDVFTPGVAQLLWSCISGRVCHGR